MQLRNKKEEIRIKVSKLFSLYLLIFVTQEKTENIDIATERSRPLQKLNLLILLLL